MLPGIRRTAAAASAALLLAAALAACGSSGEKKDSSSGGVDGVSFTGSVGKSIKASWQKKIASPSSTKVTTLVQGKGDKVAKGDSVSTYLWIGDGTTKKAVYDDYTNGSAETIPTTQLNGTFAKLFSGARYGSRVAAVTTASELFGSSSGNAQLGVGGEDTVVVVADLVEKAAVSPTPSDAKVHDVPKSKLPAVVSKAGKPSGLSWTGIAKPSASTPVQRTVLIKGSGTPVKATDTIKVNYLGETYQATTPFDESYTKQPLTSALSGLIPGWKIGLAGVPVGSRVLLQIPPAYGYGAQGSGSTIPGNATLWFVIDVVGVS